MADERDRTKSRSAKSDPKAKGAKPPLPKQDTPLGRPGQPREMAPIYVLLASDEASYITGVIYGATGGKPLF